jgi:hypothetical protein
MAAPKSELEVILAFAGSFLWPATVLIALAMFRKQLRSLLDRISLAKFWGQELVFQTPAPDSGQPTTPLRAEDIVHTEQSTFLTEGGVRDVIRDSGLLESGDEIYRAMVIFVTRKQRTWIAFSKRKLFCLLDDEETRSSGRLIQWSLPRENAKPVKAREYKQTVGRLDIGNKTNWLYSTRLFPSPAIIEREIRKAIAEGE